MIHGQGFHNRRTKRSSGAASASLIFATGRLNAPGYLGYVGSNGTSIASNNRVSCYNETGATITKLKAYWANWKVDTAGCTNGANSITIAASIEYPSGTFNQVLFGGSASKVITAGANAASDEITLSTPIPAGVQYWVRTYVSVSAGQTWVQGYQMNTAASGLEGAEFFTTAPVDRTMTGTIVQPSSGNVNVDGVSTVIGTNYRGYGPIGVVATAWTGTPVTKSWVQIGDSTDAGATDNNVDSHGGNGYYQRALNGKYPHLKLSLSGTKAADWKAASLAPMLDLLDQMGACFTDAMCGHGNNDVQANTGGANNAAKAATIVTNLQAQALLFTSRGMRAHCKTVSTRTTSTDTWKTLANQTVSTSPTTGVWTGGASSLRHTLNVLLRAVPAGFTGCYDYANSIAYADDITPAANSDKFMCAGVAAVAGYAGYTTNTGASTDAASGDGTHVKAQTTSAPLYGGVYAARDAFIAYA